MLFLRGNFCVGPNGFTKHDGNDTVKNMFSIYWFPGYGLSTVRIINGKKTSKVRFRRIAKLLLRYI